ncbi:MAG: hypothetical protein ACR2M3_09190 [Thermomicrobiales bacterium]
MTRLFGRLLTLVALGIILSSCTDTDVTREHAAGQTLSNSVAATLTPSDVRTPSASPDRTAISTPTHDVPETGLPSTTVVIQAALGWQITGQAQLSSLPSGDRQLRAAVHGPAAELTRSDGGINLMWHIIAGNCNGVARIPTPKVFYRNNFPVTSLTQQTFVLTMPSEWNAPSFSLAAFANINGTGRLAACADIPSHP